MSDAGDRHEVAALRDNNEALGDAMAKTRADGDRRCVRMIGLDGG